jgi:hypothetical protein
VAVCSKPVFSAPVAASTAAMFFAGWPPTVLNLPPIQAVLQSAGSSAMLLADGRPAETSLSWFQRINVVL